MDVNLSTKSIFVIAVMLVALGSLWFFQHKSRIELMEGFAMTNAELSKRSSFFDGQMRLFQQERDLQLEVRNPLTREDNERTAKALEDVDIFLPDSERPDAGIIFDSDTMQRVLRMEAVCKRKARAEDLPSNVGKPRAACGWLHNPDPGRRSVASIGTHKGPLLKSVRDNMGTQRWIWNREIAIKAERIKFCRTVRSCDMVQHVNFPTVQCGFCPGRGGIPVDSRGFPLYPDTSCPVPPITNQKDCFRPVTVGGAGQRTPRCEEGNLSLDCRRDLARAATCVDNGVVLSALNDFTGRTTETRALPAIDFMNMYNFSIPRRIVTDGKMSVEAASTAMNTIATATQSGSARVRMAANNLCYGSAFDPCALSDTDVAPFPLKCLEGLANNAGCQRAGTQYPTESNKGYYDSLGNWAKVKIEIQNLVKRMRNTTREFTQEQQKDALAKCLGTKVRKSSTRFCDEVGVQVMIIVDDNIYGRRVFDNSFPMITPDNNFIDFLDLPSRYGSCLLIIDFNIIPPTENFPIGFTRGGNVVHELTYNGKRISIQQNFNFERVSLEPQRMTSTNPDDNKFKGIFQIPQWRQADSVFYLQNNSSDIPISMCRLPFEKRSPLINYSFKDGVQENPLFRGIINGDFSKVSRANRGGFACGDFSSGFALIRNSFVLSRFRSYTTMVWLDKVGICPRIFSLHNGTDYFSCRDCIDVEMGNGNTTLLFQHKPNTGFSNIKLLTTDRFRMGSWNHVAIVINDDLQNVSMYLNGALTGQIRLDIKISETPVVLFIGGGVTTASQIQGCLRWFRMFDYPMTITEVKQDMDDDW